MIDRPPYVVRVVVDPAFGERLASLPQQDPVWIIDSPANAPVAHRLWEMGAKGHADGITTFQSGAYGVAEDELVCMLDTIDLHHGPYSADPPYSLIEVFGCQPLERIREALKEIGFQITESTSDGFIASNDVA
jgi:hypothetical protein